MDIQLDRDLALKALQMVQSIVEPRQTMPILANVLLEAAGDTARITATDLEIGATVSLPATVATAGGITLAARKLVEIVKELTAATLTLKVQDNAWVSLRCGGASYKLAGLAADDFPKVVPSTPTAWVTCDAGALREMLERTSFAMSHDESRFALNGVLFAFQGKELRLVATDGHRLAIAVRPLAEESPSVSGIVPRKAVHEIQRVLGASETVQLALAENQFVMRMPNFVMMARLIEGQFPNYDAVLPKNLPYKLTLPRGALMSAVRRVAVMAALETKPIKLTVGSGTGTLTLTAYHPELGEAEESLEVAHAGEEIVIGFNSRYLMDALSPLEADQVVLELRDGQSAGVLRSFEEPGTLCVIMPMRI
jgi:DNA polymerase-3 subunit beta